jgi:hypothetical protein
VYFTELPKEVQQRFNYDPQNAAAFSAQQAAASAVDQNQQQKELEERQHQKDAAVAQGAEAQGAWNRSRNLQDHYQVLQQQENALQQRIDEAERPGPGYYYHGHLRHHPNPAAWQLSSLHHQMADVRSEEKRVANELNKPQR